MFRHHHLFLLIPLSSLSLLSLLGSLYLTLSLSALSPNDIILY